jgi:polar amino acid transport system substrate-binding protein
MRIGFLFFALYFFNFNTFANDDVLVVTEVMPPFQIINEENGQLEGLGVDIVEYLLKEAAIESPTHVLPWARAYKLASTTPNTIIFTLASTKERQKDFIWIGDIDRQRIFYWGLRANFNRQKRNSFSAKAHYIGVSRHSNIESYFIQQSFKKLYPLVNEDHGLQMLFNKRIDLFVESEISIRYRSQKLDLNFDDLIRLDEIPALNQNLGIAVNKASSKELIHSLQNAYKRLENKGIIEQLRRKWLDDLPAR